jgi:hypothetical protein
MLSWLLAPQVSSIAGVAGDISDGRRERLLAAGLAPQVATIAGVAGDISDGLRERLRVAGLDPRSMFVPGRGAWEVWLLLRDRWGR